MILIFVMKTNLMHYLSLIYFNKQPLHVSGVFIAHHQEVFTVYVQQLVCVIHLSWLAAGWVRMIKMILSFVYQADKTVVDSVHK
jgi:hypothetical protein